MFKGAALPIVACIFVAHSAQATCIYHGADNVKTTISREFRDAPWVVRAHVISADYHWSDSGESWTRYKLKIVTTFKGNLPNTVYFFTMRDSGGFYLDGPNATPDLDHDYLLFLDRYPKGRNIPQEARGAFAANYSCGVSRQWDELSPNDVQTLDAMSRKGRVR